MRLILMLAAAALILAGCTSAKTNLESKHGYSGRVNGTWTDINVVPTIIQSGESALQSDYGSMGQMRDMPSTFEADAAGNLRATGVAAYLMALANLCGRAPQAEMCGNAAARQLQPPNLDDLSFEHLIPN